MKTGAQLLIILIFSLLPFNGKGQSCSFLDSISDIQMDQLCSPVEVITWNVSYTKVDDNNTPVSIYFDWDDGITDTIPAVEGPDSTFSISTTHPYVSVDDRCNYQAVARLVVNGVVCPESSVEETVTVWDVDSENGAYVYASPDIYPVCIGKGDTVRFDDDTRYNCVPPQEEDNPNDSTRWIQWVYGTNSTADNFLSSDVSVDGYTGPWPYVYPAEPEVLPYPSHGYSGQSLPIIVASDTILGEEFRVELRYWNYCNKYTDGKDPVIDSSVIRIMYLAVSTITPVDPFCLSDLPYDLEASTPNGTWSGPGITDVSEGIFNPAVAGVGSHKIAFLTDPDPDGCIGTDTVTIEVRDLPLAEILTDDASWCDNGSNSATMKVLTSGAEGSTFDLDYKIFGVESTLFNQTAGIVELLVNNQPGINEYILLKVTEHNGPTSCEAPLNDTLVFRVDTLPTATLSVEYDDPCSPVEVHFEATPGFSKYSWNFGSGVIESTSSQANQIFTFDYADHMNIVGNDTIFSKDDSTYQVSLKVETYEGCVDSISESITVYPLPEADFHVFPETSEYPNSTVTLTNMSSMGNWSYLWSFGDETTDFNENPGTHSYSESGTFGIQLVTFNEFCSDSITKEVTIQPPPALASFYTNIENGCLPLVVNFTNTSQHADTYNWDFKDNNQFSSDTNTTHTFITGGDYNVTMTAVGLSGTDTATHLISVYELPEADFTASPTQTGNLKQLFEFTNSSQGDSYCLWDFGDGTTSAVNDPTHVYEEVGTYSVTLYVWSEQNCTDTLVLENYIRVNAGEGSIEFPTAFFWNGSGPTGGNWNENTSDNTIFYPEVVNVKEFKMIIYSRWGEQVFESNDLYIGWDGYLKSGEAAAQGVYVYKVYVTYVDGIEDILIGDITFIH